MSELRTISTKGGNVETRSKPKFEAVRALSDVLVWIGALGGIIGAFAVIYLLLQNNDQVYGATHHTNGGTIVGILIGAGFFALSAVASGQLLRVLLAIEENTRPAAVSPAPSLPASEAPEPKPDAPRFASREEYERFKAEHKEAGRASAE